MSMARPMPSPEEAKPGVMPVDRQAWLRQLNGSNFVNAGHEFKDVLRFGAARRILVVGPGQGLGVQVLKSRGYEVVTLDIDATFSPDHVGSVHDLHMFRNREFDVVVASHVLEHLPVSYLDCSISELARVAHAALVYLPVAGRHFQLRLKADMKGLDKSLFIDVFNYLRRPSGARAEFCQGQHYWELGYRGFTRADVRRRLSACFDVVDEYRNPDWNPSYNFVLKARP